VAATAAPLAKTATEGSSGMLRPLVLAQFLCSYAASSLNVAISAIAGDLGTNVTGVQTAITVFTLTMAALMIPGSKLTDILGRKRCFMIGLAIYGIGALVASASQGLTGLTVGYSLLQGIGTALLIPPVYILATIFYTDMATRARAFGAISAAAGVGAALGPLVGGLITTSTSWRVSFLLQAALVVGIVVLARVIQDVRPKADTAPRFDLTGAVQSAAGLFFLVVGLLLTGTYGWVTSLQDFAIGDTVLISQGGISPIWLFEAIGFVLLWAFWRHIGSVERAGGEPLLHTRMLRNRVANLGLVTQHLQWLILLGLSFVVSVFLQTARGYNAVQTGLILTPATIGILVSSMLAERMAKRRAQAAVVRGGFILTAVGLVLLLVFVDATSNVLTFIPGLLAIGLGVGAMLTASVNVVQSSFPEADQGEISGLSRSVSNLGSSVGVALAGSVLVSPLVSGNQGYALALVVLTVFALIGVATAWLGPRGLRESAIQAGRTAAQATSASSGKGGLRRAG
jgi:MFS family permease